MNITKNLHWLTSIYQKQLKFSYQNTNEIKDYFNSNIGSNLRFSPRSWDSNGENKPVEFGKVLYFEKVADFDLSIYSWNKTLAKLSPVRYDSRGEYSYHELLLEHQKQILFYNNMIKIDLNNIDDAILSYNKFLSTCKAYPKDVIIPTLMEDLIWHAHMNDHYAYVNDMKTIFGHILDHNTSIDTNLVKNKSVEIRLDFNSKTPLLNPNRPADHNITTTSNNTSYMDNFTMVYIANQIINRHVSNDDNHNTGNSYDSGRNYGSGNSYGSGEGGSSCGGGGSSCGGGSSE